MQLSLNIDIQLIQNNLAPVVQKLDSAIQWLNHYPTDELTLFVPCKQLLMSLKFCILTKNDLLVLILVVQECNN